MSAIISLHSFAFVAFASPFHFFIKVSSYNTAKMELVFTEEYDAGGRSPFAITTSEIHKCFGIGPSRSCSCTTVSTINATGQTYRNLAFVLALHLVDCSSDTSWTASFIVLPELIWSWSATYAKRWLCNQRFVGQGVRQKS